MSRTVINPDEPIAGRFASYRHAHPRGRTGRSTFADVAAKHQSPAEQILRNFKPVAGGLSRAHKFRQRTLAAGIRALAEAAPSNLTVTRRDGTIVYREDRLK